MTNNPSFRLNWYGERGIVNALVTHIATHPEPLMALSCLLSAIEWADGTPAAWARELRDAAIYVEVGLADFGNPDLIIVCTGADGLRRLVFVEAKAGPYIFSARSNAVGMREPGFNSAINGQLALKYRFAQALEATAAVPEQAPPVIAESPTMLAHYQLHLRDPRNIPRRLFKPEVIANLLVHNALLGHPANQCCYVALTWDIKERAFFRDEQVGDDRLPLFLDVDGNSSYEDTKHRIGWLGYRACVEALRLDQNATFQGALQTMVPRLEPTPGDYVVGQTAADISPEAIAAAEQIAQLVFPGRKVARYPGSLSILDQGQTVAKILPRESSVFVGVRETFNPASWFGGDLKDISIQGVRFWGIEVPLDIADRASLIQLTSGMAWRE